MNMILVAAVGRAAAQPRLPSHSAVAKVAMGTDAATAATEFRRA